MVWRDVRRVPNNHDQGKRGQAKEKIAEDICRRMKVCQCRSDQGGMVDAPLTRTKCKQLAAPELQSNSDHACGCDARRESASLLSLQ